jgi:hypothetical protein
MAKSVMIVEAACSPIWPNKLIYHHHHLVVHRLSTSKDAAEGGCYLQGSTLPAAVALVYNSLALLHDYSAVTLLQRCYITVTISMLHNCYSSAVLTVCSRLRSPRISDWICRFPTGLRSTAVDKKGTAALVIFSPVTFSPVTFSPVTGSALSSDLFSNTW